MPKPLYRKTDSRTPLLPVAIDPDLVRFEKNLLQIGFFGANDSRDKSRTSRRIEQVVVRDGHKQLIFTLHQMEQRAPPIGPSPVFQIPIDVKNMGLAGNAVTTALESISVTDSFPQPEIKAVVSSSVKLSPEAYAFYEKKGSDARIQIFVRPVDVMNDVYSFETSNGEYSKGPADQVALQYLALDRKLNKDGFTRMQSFNGTSGQWFNLP